MRMAQMANNDDLTTFRVIERELPTLNIEVHLETFLDDLDAAEETRETYRRVIKIFNRYLKENRITSPTYADILKYKQNLLAQGKRAHTIQNYIIGVKQFFKWTSKKSVMIYPNVAEDVKNVKIKNKGHYKDYLKKENIVRIANDFDRSTLKGKRDYAMYVLMLTTGARSIELHRMDVQDITTKASQLVILIQGKGETEKARPIKVSKTTYAAIVDYLAARGDYKPQDPLFISTGNKSRGGRITTRTIRGVMKSAFRESGIDSPTITCHSLRHSFATHNLLNGGSFEETKEAMGHSSITVTQRYAHNYQWELNHSESRVDDALFN